jgi:hypothetical protein
MERVGQGASETKVPNLKDLEDEALVELLDRKKIEEEELEDVLGRADFEELWRISREIIAIMAEIEFRKTRSG